MVSIGSRSCSPPLLLLRTNALSLRFSFSPSAVSLSVFPSLYPVRFPALRTSVSDQDVGGDPNEPMLLQKPPISSSDGISGISDVRKDSAAGGSRRKRKWVHWEDQILGDTVPLVAFARMILHSGKYENGDRLSPEHEKTILERLLPYHPDLEEKVGCGIDFITARAESRTLNGAYMDGRHDHRDVDSNKLLTKIPTNEVGYHPQFEKSRCLFIVRKDGVAIDFSYWKCIKGLIRKKYPLYADNFIFRHFRERSNSQGKETTKN